MTPWFDKLSRGTPASAVELVNLPFDDRTSSSPFIFCYHQFDGVSRSTPTELVEPRGLYHVKEKRLT